MGSQRVRYDWATFTFTSLLRGRKAMTQLDSVFKSRDFCLPTKIHLVKAMVFPVVMYWCENAKLRQSCPTLCDPIDDSPPGSSVPGILQARTLEWVAISFSNAWKWKVKVKSLSPVQLLATPWTAAHQAPLSMGFSRQEYWTGVPLPFKSLELPYNLYPLTTFTHFSTHPQSLPLATINLLHFYKFSFISFHI